jgi:hypothetical protein
LLVCEKISQKKDVVFKCKKKVSEIKRKSIFIFNLKKNNKKPIKNRTKRYMADHREAVEAVKRPRWDPAVVGRFVKHALHDDGNGANEEQQLEVSLYLIIFLIFIPTIGTFFS